MMGSGQGPVFNQSRRCPEVRCAPLLSLFSCGLAPVPLLTSPAPRMKLPPLLTFLCLLGK